MKFYVGIFVKELLIFSVKVVGGGDINDDAMSISLNTKRVFPQHVGPATMAVNGWMKVNIATRPRSASLRTQPTIAVNAAVATRLDTIHIASSVSLPISLEQIATFGKSVKLSIRPPSCE